MTDLSVEHNTPKWKLLSDEQWQQSLSKQHYEILRKKHTEPRKKGKPNFEQVFPVGTYHCVGCHSPLYHSTMRFECGCGWPAFESTIQGAVTEQPDVDGHRTEVLCSVCLGHLGHVFRGEELTPTNTRYCINECILEFYPS